jgi:hypothetical protein
MNIVDAVKELLLRGVLLETDGDNLNVIGPASALTEATRATLAENKAGVIAMLQRSTEIKNRINNAIDEVENKYSGRIEWDRDTPDVRMCEILLNAAMCRYVEGDCTLKDVEKEFKAYILALSDQYEVKLYPAELSTPAEGEG